MTLYIEGGSLSGCSSCSPSEKFTPGPYESGGVLNLKPQGLDESFRPIRSGGTAIALIWMNRPGHDGNANARLFAAAPDLLKACKGLLAVIEEYQTGEDESSPAARISAATDAIARAVRA